MTSLYVRSNATIGRLSILGSVVASSIASSRGYGFRRSHAPRRRCVVVLVSGQVTWNDHSAGPRHFANRARAAYLRHYRPRGARNLGCGTLVASSRFGDVDRGRSGARRPFWREGPPQACRVGREVHDVAVDQVPARRPRRRDSTSQVVGRRPATQARQRRRRPTRRGIHVRFDTPMGSAQAVGTPAIPSLRRPRRHRRSRAGTTSLRAPGSPLLLLGALRAVRRLGWSGPRYTWLHEQTSAPHCCAGHKFPPCQTHPRQDPTACRGAPRPGHDFQTRRVVCSPKVRSACPFPVIALFPRRAPRSPEESRNVTGQIDNYIAIREVQQAVSEKSPNSHRRARCETWSAMSAHV
jgi:hypothetical protein